MKFLLYVEKVLVAYLIVMCMSLVASCSDEFPRQENIYPIEIERALDTVYGTACDYLNVRYDYHATDEKKISVIRCADIADEGGDVFPEMDEYNDIALIVWPHGYGNE